MTNFSYTQEQCHFVNHAAEIFVEACPGSGKTQTIIARLARIKNLLPPRKGVAILSFTNSAVDEFIRRSSDAGLGSILRFPSFIGTFDSFVRQFLVLPSGIDGVDEQPIIVDSWNTLGVEIRLWGKKAFSGDGVSLDQFDSETNEINPDSIGHNGLKNHVNTYKEEYIQVAKRRRHALRNNGYLSANDARVELLNKLKDKDFASCLGKSISARFFEMTVDEAQDCNPLDIKILSWLRSHCLPITIVCDPDQAIYGFRDGNPQNLADFSQKYMDKSNHILLTGNFRSSPSICSLAATLRNRKIPDNSLGKNKSVNYPIHVIVYSGKTVPCSVRLCA